MKEQSDNRFKGYIQCPICKSKEFVEEGARGKVSHKCACGHIILSDYDLMTAEEIPPIRGGLRSIAKKIAL